MDEQKTKLQGTGWGWIKGFLLIKDCKGRSYKEKKKNTFSGRCSKLVKNIKI